MSRPATRREMVPDTFFILFIWPFLHLPSALKPALVLLMPYGNSITLCGITVCLPSLLRRSPTYFFLFRSF